MKINIKTIWYTFVHYCQLRYDAFRLWVAIKFADAKQRAYNKRYYVIPDYNNKLQVLNNDEIKILQTPRNIKRLIRGKVKTFKTYAMNPHATHLDIMRECYYYTSLKLNEIGSRIPKAERLKRKEKWLTYMEKQRMEANYGKRNKSKKKRG
jgi:hypothetical protein